MPPPPALNRYTLPRLLVLLAPLLVLLSLAVPAADPKASHSG